MAPQKFPVASLDEALPHLRAPFTPAAVRFKVQTYNVERGAGLVVSYIDARLVIERLNLVVGGDWEDEYRLVDRGMECRLSIHGKARIDVGVAESAAAGGPKALYSDAFKRAAVKWGIGVSLYAIPNMRIGSGDVWLRDNGKKVGGLNDGAITKIRSGYDKWLQIQGVQMFGGAIDHGDAIDAVGDHEVVDTDTGEVLTAKAPVPTPVGEGNRNASGVSTTAQHRKIFATANEAGLSDEELHYVLKQKGNVDSIKDLSKDSVDKVIEAIPVFAAWKAKQAEKAMPKWSAAEIANDTDAEDQ
jgi:hypothetical protein